MEIWDGARFSRERRPAPGPRSAILQSRAEWETAVREARELGLPVHPDHCKNWDTLRALDAILRAPARGPMVDAGGERYSTVARAVALYAEHGSPRVANPVFDREMLVETTGGLPVLLGPGRCEELPAQNGELSALACLSVIEHGVDIGRFLREAARCLMPGGVLCLSFDYWPDPVDCRGLEDYGVPIRIFEGADLQAMITSADALGLGLLDREELGEAAAAERAVTWRGLDLYYTFAMLSFEKR